MKITILILSHNDATALSIILNKINIIYPDYEVVVINDGSSDETPEVARSAGAIVFTHKKRRGMGASLKTGIEHTTNNTVVVMRGDGRHLPEDIAHLIKHANSHDLIIGARHQSNAGILIYVIRRIHNKIAKLIFNDGIVDLTSEFMMINKKNILKAIGVIPESTTYPVFLTLNCFYKNCSIKYVSVKERRKLGKGKTKLVEKLYFFFLILSQMITSLNLRS